MPKTLVVTVEVEVDDLSAEQLELLRQCDAPDVLDDTSELGEATAREAACGFENITEHTSQELFAGSNSYLRYLECRVIEANWK